MTQTTIDWTVQPVDPHLTAAEKPRLSRQAALILERLRQGSATNRQLMDIALRYGGRVHDLRRAGYTIEIDGVGSADGVTTYRLVVA